MEVNAFKEWLANPLSLFSVTALVVWAVWAVLRAYGAGAATYVSKKSEHLATKEDFDQLMAQLKANTEATEAIKAAVGQKDWIEREWKAVRIKNLELFMTSAFETLMEFRKQIDGYEELTPATADDGSSILRLRTLQKLYYPELDSSVNGFVLACYTARSEASTFYQKHRASGSMLKAQAIAESAEQRAARDKSVQAGFLRVDSELQVLVQKTFELQQ